MAQLNNTNIAGSGFLQIPSGTSSSGTQGTLRYNVATNNMEYYISDQGGTWNPMALPWAARNIPTVGYLNGGYAASSVWNNTNRIQFAIDTVVNLGDNTQEAGHNYQSSGFSNRRNFTWGASGSHCVAASNVICFDMITEQPITSGYTRTWPFSHINNGTIMNEQYYCYVTSGYGGSVVYEWNLTTETLGSTYGTSGGIWGAWTENYGIFYGSGERNFYWSNRTNITRNSPTAVSGDGYQHTFFTRQQTTVAGREGNPSSNWRITNYTNNTSYDAIGGKPSYSGEENHLSAAAWGYSLGWYQGVHVNSAYKVNFATYSGFNGGSAMNAKGKVGNSSGTMSWRP